MSRRRTPDGQDFFRLQRAQQFNLQMLWNLADLIEENSSAARLFKQPFLVGKSAGERPFHVTEEQTFEERFGQSPAVDGQEKFIVPIAVSMNREGNELLSRAAITGDEHGCLGMGHLLDHLQDIADDFALADDIIEMKGHWSYSSLNLSGAQRPQSLRSYISPRLGNL